MIVIDANLNISLIALFLGRLRMTTLEALRAYERLVKEISPIFSGTMTSSFGRPNLSRRVDKATEVFEQVFQEICSSVGYNSNDPMEEGDKVDDAKSNT